MKQMYVMFVLVSFLVLFASTENFSQQILDSANTVTTDNLSDNNLGSPTATPGTVLSGPKYKEIPPDSAVFQTTDGFWENVGGVYYGGTHRRTARLGAGIIRGAKALFSFDVPVSDHYLVYHHMGNSPNSSTRVRVKFHRFGEGTPASDFYYNERDNNIYDGTGSWFPLDIVEAFSSDSALTVELGIDSSGTNTFRVDGVRILKSSQLGPDIEFGNRRSDQLTIDAGTGDTLYYTSFFKDGFSFNAATQIRTPILSRAPLNFTQTTFKFDGFSDVVLPVYNLGSDPLVITGVSAQTSRFYSATSFPLIVQPGQKADLNIRFAPLGEEVTFDTLLILSNDALEPEAVLPVRGEGINYNFILNASNGGIEQHWNAPSDANYQELQVFANSITSPYPYPIVGGNTSSRVHTAGNAEAAAIYSFTLSDSLFGKYYIEYGGPISSNAATGAVVTVSTPFIDTVIVNNFVQSGVIQGNRPWARVGGNKVFDLQSGGLTTVMFTNPSLGGFLRADLLRMRLVPEAPDITTSIDPARLLNFGLVSIFDSVRLKDFNYQRNFTIASTGETPLVIDTMYLVSGQSFQIVNMPTTFPFTLPAIDGIYNLIVEFLPDSIKSYPDQLIVFSNDPNDSSITINFSGQGVGTGIIVDNDDVSNLIFPADIIPAGTPKETSNMHQWFEYTSTGAINQTGLYAHIYFTPSSDVQRIEWFPTFPYNPNNPGVNEPDSFNVFVQVPVSSPNSSPAAKYRIKHFDGTTDTVISQLNRTLNGGKIPLGKYTFLRGGKDSPGSGTVFGSVELINDTALVSAFYADSIVNTARQDTFVLRADAIIFEQASNVIVGITDENLLPTEYYMSQNYPNPFNPTTQIRFALPQSGMVELKIYDILGREVVTLLSGEHNAGTYTVEWSGKNNYGVSVSSGMYIYRISAGNFVQTKKMMMLK